LPNSGKNYHRPYAAFIRDLYARKPELKRNSEPLYLPVKIMLNSVYGKAGEILERKSYRVMGTLYNPIIFSHILGSATEKKSYRQAISNAQMDRRIRDNLTRTTAVKSQET